MKSKTPTFQERQSDFESGWNFYVSQLGTKNEAGAKARLITICKRINVSPPACVL